MTEQAIAVADERIVDTRPVSPGARARQRYLRNKPALISLIVLGGILVAHQVSEREKALRLRHGPSGQGKLHRFLDKINHRDYAVVILALTVVRGLHVFLWLSSVGLQVYWLTLLVLLYRHWRRV